jgi:hypothetical protein
VSECTARVWLPTAGRTAAAAGASKKEARREEATELAKEGGGGVRAGALMRVLRRG